MQNLQQYKQMQLTPEEILKKRWGYDTFKPLQKEAIEAALAGRDCLVVLPTGGGKSLCYQLPAAMGKGLVLVVSPLIALMDDQVAAAREAGIEADALHSNLKAAHRGAAWQRLAEGKTQLLYVSPERLLAGDILNDISGRLILAAVDEALAQETARGNLAGAVIDIHAEATSEKVALGWYLDGRALAVLGTHTHIPTRDEWILPQGTAYVTDVGMTGIRESVLGVKTDIILRRFIAASAERFEPAEVGTVMVTAVVVTFDPVSGRASEIERLTESVTLS